MPSILTSVILSYISIWFRPLSTYGMELDLIFGANLRGKPSIWPS